jgi:hypothetical protein
MSATRDGGKPMMRDVMNYSPPQGPKSMSNNSVGLGGTNIGCCGTQGMHGAPGARSSGSPGLGGERMPTGGQQGRR